MKKFLMFLIIAHSLAFVCNGMEEIHGLWAATVFQLDFPSREGLSPDRLEQEIAALVQRTKEHGFNALFFQVRPCADAFYPSQYFPWSAWLTGSQGQPPADGFDPLACLTETAHEAGIQLHAWVNPFRITRTKATSKADALAKLSPDHPARLHPNWAVFHSDGCLYFDPGQPAVRQLVLDGVLEIAQNYAVDGIHFDDYFYPGTDFDDAVSYAFYGGDCRDRDHFRTESVNRLIAEVHTGLKALRPDILFGVSPTGIWANADTDPRGSDTVGYESKVECYADSLAWMEAGTVDYVAPQLYWAIGAKEGEFVTLLNWWREQAARTGTDLLIGLAGYRTAETQDAASVWYGGDQISRQLALLQGVTEGYILFRAGSLFDSPALAACFGASSQPPEPQPEYWPLTRRWLGCGDDLEVACRDDGTVTLAMWSGHSLVLREGIGKISNVPTGSAPVIYARFSGSSLLVEISPGVVTVPQTETCLSFREQQSDRALVLEFTFSGSVEASAAISGNRVLLDIPAQDYPLLFESALLTGLDCLPLSPGCRYVLTPEQSPSAIRLETAENRVILHIQ